MKYGIIAAGHIKTAETGLEILKMGGNAFDAAIAAMLAACVAEPTTTSAAGGGFMIAHTQEGFNKCYDFFAQTPISKQIFQSPDFYPVTIDFGSTTQDFHIGMASAALPGFIDGIFTIHQSLGKLPLQAIFEPVIDLCKKGVTVTAYQERTFRLLSPIITIPKTGQDIFYNAASGAMKKVGEVLKFPGFADTLDFLIKEGKRGFYEGEIAQSIVQDSMEKGGYLRMQDFIHYQTIEREPLLFQYKNNTLLGNPPPSFGGTLIAFALALLEKTDISQIEWRSKKHITLLKHIIEQSSLARVQKLDKNIYDKDIVHQFLSPEFLALFEENLAKKLNGTTHISVIDKAGNAASVTTSHGEGSGYYIPHTQIMLNNMLGEEDLNPYGFHQWKEGMRLSSMMSPTIVLDQNHKPKIVTGTGGANRIRTIVFQILHQLLDFDLGINELINGPRMHYENNTLYLEPGFKEENYIQDPNTAEKLVTWDYLSMFFGGAHSLYRNQNGDCLGAGDVRRDGACLTI